MHNFCLRTNATIGERRGGRTRFPLPLAKPSRIGRRHSLVALSPLTNQQQSGDRPTELTMLPLPDTVGHPDGPATREGAGIRRADNEGYRLTPEAIVRAAWLLPTEQRAVPPPASQLVPVGGCDRTT